MTRALKGFSLVLVVCALVPAAARANDYYVSQSGSGSACMVSATPCDLATALSQANMATGANTVHITGPLTLSGISMLVVGGGGSNVSLVGSGSGSGGTSLSSAAAVLYVFPGSSVAHLSAQSGATPVVLALGGSMDDVVASTTAPITSAVSVSSIPSGGDTTISHSVLSAPSSDPFPTLVTSGDTAHRTIVSDSKITGGSGIQESPGAPVPGVKGLHVVRSVIDVTNIAASLNGPDDSISDSVIHVSSPGGQGVSISNSFSGNASHVDLAQDTLVGPGGSGTSSGVYVPPALMPFMPGSATVTGSIVRGFATDLNVLPAPPGTWVAGSANATLSDFDNAVSGQGNLATDPKFVDAAAGDYRLSSGSPAIDAAGDAPANGETDLAGNPRMVDGNGDGVAARDMGAYEVAAVVPPAPPAAPAVPSTPKPRIKTLALSFTHGRLTVGRNRIVYFNVGCPKSAAFACRVTVTLQGSTKASRLLKLGSGHATLARGKHAKVRIRLSRKAFALIKKHKLRHVTVTVSAKDAQGASIKSKRRYAIRFKR